MEEVLESGLVLAISCLIGQPDMRAAVRLGMGLLKTPSNKDLPEPITNNKNVEELRSLLAAMAQQFIQERAARQSVESELASIKEQHEILKYEVQSLKEKSESNQSEFKAIKANYDALEKELENAKKCINEWMASSKSWQKDSEFWHAKADPKYATRQLEYDKQEQEAWEDYRNRVIREIKNPKSRNSYGYRIRGCGYSMIDQYNWRQIEDEISYNEMTCYAFGYKSEYEYPNIPDSEILIDESPWNPLIFCRGNQTTKRWFDLKEEDDQLSSQNEDLTGQDYLMEKLRLLRKKLADEQKVHPHIVCSNMSLLEMVDQKPITHEDFAKIAGIGAKELELYANLFIEVIRPYYNLN